MRTPTYRELVENPHLIDALHAQARRERAAAFDHYVIAPARALFHADRPKAAPRGLKYHRA
jgi:hypothetical protein